MTDLALHLDRVSPVPLYYQLARALEGAISTGTLPKGEFLDNELELADRWQVSRPTVRRAIQELVDAGLLVRRRGVGTQVVNDQVRRPIKLSSLFDDLAAEGRSPSTDVLVHRRERASKEIAQSLGLPTGTEVVYLERRRSVGSIRLALMRNWLIVEAAGSLTTEQLQTSGLYALIRSAGIRPHYATQRIGATVAGEIEAEVLGVRVGAPLVTMRRVMQDLTGRPVEIGQHVYDAEHYSVEMNVVEN